MSEETSNLEREAEMTRARIADTAEELRARMTPGQMIDELTSSLRTGDGAAAINNLKTQVRDNPLPLALVGVGLAWLALGKGTTPSTLRSYAPSYGSDTTYRGSSGADYASDDDWYNDDATDKSQSGPGIGERLQGAASGASSAINRATHDARDALGGAANAVGNALGSTQERLGAAGSSVYKGGRSFARGTTSRARDAQGWASDAIQREPLITAAVGAAIGLALGALLPKTSVEDTQFGAASDELKHRAKDLASDGIAQAKEVASETFDALKDAADKEGLTNDGKPLAERVSSVLSSTADHTQSSVKDRLSGSSETSNS